MSLEPDIERPALALLTFAKSTKSHSSASSRLCWMSGTDTLSQRKRIACGGHGPFYVTIKARESQPRAWHFIFTA